MQTSSPAPTRPAPRRSAVVLAVLVTVVAMVVAAVPARAAGSEAAELTSWVGQARASAGTHGLEVAGDLVEVATRHAQRMAAEGRLHHNPNLSQEVSGWQRLTENVGYGPEPRPVHDAFMASASHRTNILDTEVTQIGVGTARGADGTLWVAQVFRLPTGASPPPPAPEPEPTPPAPDPTPAPGPTQTSAPAAPAPSAPPSAPAPVTSSTPAAQTAVAPGPPVLTWSLAEVGPAPAPATIVGPAGDGGDVGPAPSPAAATALDLAWWLVVVTGLFEA